MFRKVGVSLDELDLEPVADVVEKLKENKDGINDILDNLRGVDVNEYINQAKRIEWKELLNGAEEIMGFIKSSDGKPLKVPSPSIGMPKLPTLPTPEPIPEPSVEDLLLSMDDEEEDSWFDDEDDEEWFEEQPQPKGAFSQDEEKQTKEGTQSQDEALSSLFLQSRCESVPRL